MSLPASLHAYESEIKAFDRAKEAAKGIRIEMPDENKARSYIARLHNARVLDRRENTQRIEKSSPMYGKSEFDNITVSKRVDTTGKWWVYLEKNENIPGYVEEL